MPKTGQISGVNYWIGRSAIENWELLESNLLNSPNNLWFHVHNFTSAYLILEPTENSSVIYQAAILCKQHSKSKSLSVVDIIYTPIFNLKKGDKLGQALILTPKLCNFIKV